MILLTFKNKALMRFPKLVVQITMGIKGSSEMKASRALLENSTIVIPTVSRASRINSTNPPLVKFWMERTSSIVRLINCPLWV